MKLKVFAVYDAKAEAYMQPSFIMTTGQAVRSFKDLVNDKQENQISKHPEDFTFFEIAEYDDQTGKFENLATPKSLGVALEYTEKIKIPTSMSERDMEMARGHFGMNL